MGFRINTNIAAMNAHRNAQQTNLGLDKSLNALSSGLRITKAADDAAGLSIANTLRQQSQGLGQAISNANDGIGITQTADGALDEYINIANTIRTKSIQAASDGQNSASREAIQSDIDRLMEEAQNIAATTSFNGQSLLNGGFENKSFHIGAYSGETVKISIGDAQTDKVADDFAMVETESFKAISAGTTVKPTINFETATETGGADGVKIEEITLLSGTAYSAAEQAQMVADAFNEQAQKDGTDVRASVTISGSGAGIRLDSSLDIGIATVGGTIPTPPVATTTATAGSDNNFSTIDVTTRNNAEKAIVIADYALKDLNKTRSDIGSVQNQLESTIRNISVTQVNVQAAESQIRDVDFAAESANFAKLNILAQSGSYAMSQANAVQQNVMRLLQ